MPRHPDADSSDWKAQTPWRRFGRVLFKGSLALGLILALAAGVVYGWYAWQAGEEDISQVGRMPERSVVFDRHGEVIGRLHGVNRISVNLDQVSPFFADALLAREDTRFYRHDGIDYHGVARATLRNLEDRQFTQGASTLTMQLARISYDIREKTLHRKMIETLLAQRIERNYSKNEILNFYVNRIYMGSGLYGVERASQAYFGKPASDLTLGESAMLAGIIRAPNRFSPFRHQEDAERERDVVLSRMLELGYITKAEELAAQEKEILVLDQKAIQPVQQSYALDAIRRDLDLILEQEDLEDGGFKIYTSLDLQLQAAAEAILEAQLQRIESQSGYPHPPRGQTDDYLQASALLIDNADGGILTLIGGRDFEESQYNRAIQGGRTIGSTFKPFVYASAWDRGLLPGTWIDDSPILPDELPWWYGDWNPRNSDGSYNGLQPAEKGLIRSRNTMSVRVGEITGVEGMVELARHAGFDPPKEDSPQIYIGNLGASLKALTSAYSAFPNGGYRLRPWIIAAIQDQRGNIIYQDTRVGYQMISPGSAWLTTDVMEKILEPGGTAASARSHGFTGPAAGKTGTTDDYRDAWFVGFTDKVTCGVWVGFDQPRRIQSRGYGSELALPIWSRIMQEVGNSGFPPEPFYPDQQVTTVEVCRSTGELARGGCERHGQTYRTEVPFQMVPRTNCSLHDGIFSRPLTNTDPNGDKPGLLGRIIRLFGDGD